jgi:flagellar basal-body rod protein FlgG
LNNSMITATASMAALQRKLDLLADNIANVNTTGFKRKSAVFEDLLTSMQPHDEGFRQPGRQTPPGFTQGWGARMSSIQIDLSQGSMQSTGNPNDLAIEGNALFEVKTPDGSPAYTRQGAFQLVPVKNGAGERLLVTNAGMPVRDANGADIIVPAGRSLSVTGDGTLMAVAANGTSTRIGQLQLVEVLKPELLRSIGENLYGIDGAAKQADVVRQLPASPDRAMVRQGFLEQSNVNMADEMADLMVVQRAYQLSARALSSGEQMLGMANNLRG